MTPTHTHRSDGGRFTMLGEPLGAGPLEETHLVKYQEHQTHLEKITTMADWEQNWRRIERDDCPVCMGAGHDQIKGNRDKPCGGCYGLGKVRADGETPADRWELATVATAIIQRQQSKLQSLQRISENPAVKALLDQQQKQAMSDSIARDEQAWRNGRGHGPGGQRHTGD